MTLTYILGGLLITYLILTAFTFIRFNIGSTARLSNSTKKQLNDEEINDIQADAYCQYGIMLHQISNFSGAILNYEKAIDLDSSNDKAHQYHQFASSGHPLPKALPDDNQNELDDSQEFSPLKSFLDSREADIKNHQTENEEPPHEEPPEEEPPEEESIAIDLSKKDSSLETLSHLEKGQELQKKGLITESIAAYDEAIKTDPKTINNYLKRATELVKAKKFPEAVDEISTVLESDPKNTNLLYKRANILLHQNLLDEAIKDYTTALKINPEDEKSLNRRGTAFFRKKQYEYARANFTKALAIDPDFIEAKNNLVRTNEKLNEIASIEQEEVPVDPNAIPDNVERIYIEGMQHLGKDDLAKALVSFNRVIRAFPKHPDSYFERACIHLSNNRLDSAIADFSKVIELDSEFSDAYCMRGKSFALLNRNEDALADFDKAIFLTPHGFDTYKQRGICNFRLERYDDAIADLSTLIEKSPRNASAYYHRGLVYKTMGKEELADLDFNKACKLGSIRACEAVGLKAETI